MNDNPYTSPLAQDRTPTDKDDRFSDRLLARRLLEAREHGYSLGLYLRWNGRQYLFLMVYFALILGGLAYLDIWMPFYIMLGIIVGRIGRDLVWVRSVTKAWPFNAKVLDWDKIERLANESR